MGKPKFKIKVKAPAGANRTGRGYAIRHIAQMELLVGTRKSLKMLHVNFDCRGRERGGNIFGVSRSDDQILEHKSRGRRGHRYINSKWKSERGQI